MYTYLHQKLRQSDISIRKELTPLSPLFDLQITHRKEYKNRGTHIFYIMSLHQKLSNSIGFCLATETHVIGKKNS
jgi:hypothetical protein